KGRGFVWLVPSRVKLIDVLPGGFFISFRHTGFGLQSLIAVDQKLLGFSKFLCLQETNAQTVFRLVNKILEMRIDSVKESRAFFKVGSGLVKFLCLDHDPTEGQQ